MSMNGTNEDVEAGGNMCQEIKRCKKINKRTYQGQRQLIVSNCVALAVLHTLADVVQVRLCMGCLVLEELA